MLGNVSESVVMALVCFMLGIAVSTGDLIGTS